MTEEREADFEAHPSTSDDVEQVGVLTRRNLLEVAGGAVAGGAVIGAGTALAGPRPTDVGAGPTDRRTVGLVGRVDQEGPVLTGYGYLVRIRGLGPSELFTEPRGTSSFDPSTEDPSTARFTYRSRAQIGTASKVGDVVTVVARGTFDLYFREGGGASFDDPSSFEGGRRIATFRAEYQNDLALQEPERANIQLTGNLRQRSASNFNRGGRARRFGDRGLQWSLEAVGRGQLLDPGPPRWVMERGGTLGVIDARTP